MHNPQLTLDAAYKFTLWYLLFSEAQWKQDKDVKNRERDECVRNIASSLIRNSLPRRQHRSCCLSGTCGRKSLTHKKIHFGRSEVSLAPGERDDVCHCLAHATACVGKPLNLLLRDYSSSASLTGNRYGGLCCMLHHIILESVTFSGIPDIHDAHYVVSELSQIVKYSRNTLKRLSLGGIPAYVNISPLLQSMKFSDTITELRLEDCGIEDISDLILFLKSSKSLRHLSLRGNHGICDSMTSLGLAVATCCCLISFDIGLCRLKDEHLNQFLNNFYQFIGRTYFIFDVSNNALSNMCFVYLREAPIPFRKTVNELNLSGHKFKNCGDVASAMFLDFPALTNIILNQCDLTSIDWQRLCKVFSQKKRYWEKLSFRGNGLAAHDIKRLATVSFKNDSYLSVAGNSIGASIHKLNLVKVLPFLRQLDFSLCDIGDEGLYQLANSLEKMELISLRVLRLDNNNIGLEGKKKWGGLQFLGKALRANSAPYLEVLSLAHNKLSLRPLLTLVDQVSSTLKELNISYSSISNEDNELSEVIGRIIRRQKGINAFEQLDVWALRVGDVEFPSLGGGGTSGDLAMWVESQRAIRLILETK